jgi:quercetin dioxygenase-like cupin family protein
MSAFSYPAREGLLIQNLTDHPVHPRTDRGNSAAYFSFPALKTLEAHLSEIPPGGTTGLHRHSSEALFYVLAGKGYSTVRQDAGAERRVD